MAKPQGELLPGTFDMLILKVLSLGAMHGWGISDRIQKLSGDAFAVQQGAIYPALQRLLRRGWATAEWRASENQRRARYYRLTASGKRQLEQETHWWRSAIAGVDRVLDAETAEE